MEQTRILLAIALSFLVFLVWGWFFDGSKPVEPERKPIQFQQEAVTQENIEPSPAMPVPDKIVMPKPEDDGRPAKTVVVETPYYRVRIPEKGAGFSSFLLNKYREKNDPESDRLQMVDSGLPSGTVRVLLDKNSLKDLGTARFISNTIEDHITVLDEPRQISFVHEDPGGLVLMKTYTFSPDTYLIDLAVTIVNNSDKTYQDSLVLALYNTVSEKAERYGFVGPSALINDSLEQVKIKKIEDKNLFSGSIKWVAYQNRYFLAGILPKEPLDATFRLVLDNPGTLLSSQLVSPVTAFPPGTRHTQSFQVYLGPKSAGILKDLNRELDRAVDFGWFNIIAKACLWLMNHIYSIIPNYGVAIIIMTLLIKIILWPLGSKSYKSMSEMKKVQPLMTEIREKYKDDKRKMNEEMMGLYRTYKINPMSGCLPMVVQIPVFIALYRMLYEAIELRHAPFFGWITDLSAPDRLFSFSFTIPFMQDPGIPVLTLIMGGTMFLQQKMSPPMGDPAQAKMMMMMPIVFTVIFINFSSGLVLYWLINNILSISQQYYIQKKYA
jgi:YidC/Oxa1 family membrane protein insertase